MSGPAARANLELELSIVYRFCLTLFAWLILCSSVYAGGEAEPGFKLTAGRYVYSGGIVGYDINLRSGSEAGNLWAGYYESAPRAESQLRAGWDRGFELGGVRIAPSVQIASMGFYSFSAQAETGEDWFVGAGIGRTNLRPYTNLNFDPNDSWSVSAGRRMQGGEVFYLQQVRDNRLSPDQQHIHAYYRKPLGSGERVTADLLYKNGLVGDRAIHKWGMTLIYDWPRFFAGHAYDPNVNFTADNMLRASLGFRF